MINCPSCIICHFLSYIHRPAITVRSAFTCTSISSYTRTNLFVEYIIIFSGGSLTDSHSSSLGNVPFSIFHQNEVQFSPTGGDDGMPVESFPCFTECQSYLHLYFSMLFLYFDCFSSLTDFFQLSSTCMLFLFFKSNFFPCLDYLKLWLLQHHTTL